MGFGFQLYSFSALFCPARTHGWTVWLASMEEPRNKRRAIDRIGQRDNVRSKTRSYCFRQPVIHSAKRHPGEKHLHAKRCSIATLTFPRRSRPNCGGCKRRFPNDKARKLLFSCPRIQCFPNLGFDRFYERVAIVFQIRV